MRTELSFQLVCALFLLCALFQKVQGSPVYEPITAFELGPNSPNQSTLLLHPNGLSYGTTTTGGAFGKGVLYSVTSQGIVDTLVHFGDSQGSARGASPGSLALDTSGDIWGTTASGGLNGHGTVFKCDVLAGTVSTIVEFANQASPNAPLYNDGAGFLWGTTYFGGASNQGTVFKILQTTGAFSTIIEFSGSNGTSKGSHPMTTLVSDGLGSLWGTTDLGWGSIYKVNAITGAFSHILEFSGTSGSAKGAHPAGLVSDGNGYLWGTTADGGANDLGTVFKINAATGTFTTVAEFTGISGAARGDQPVTELRLQGQGYLFGTTQKGGTKNLGTMFKVNTTSGILETVVDFTGVSGVAKGSSPVSGLASDAAGALVGTTSKGGINDYGTIFRFDPTSGLITTITEFVGGSGALNGSNPYAKLTAWQDGTIWGTTAYGGINDYGTVFKIHPDSGTLTKAATFNGNTSSTKGNTPYSGLTSDGRGFLWGAAYSGGAANVGAVFKIDATTSVVTSVVEFSGTTGSSKGANPYASLVLDAGFLWGTTYIGGAGNYGTVFKIDPASGAFTTVTEFTGLTGAVRGFYPKGGMVSDGSGFLWGTTVSGGSSNQGTIFKINATSGAFTSVLSFTGTTGAVKGGRPFSSLTRGAAGYLWGTTSQGGGNNNGTVFKLNTATGTFTTLVEFTGTGGSSKGNSPQADLISDGAGYLWGTTKLGGGSNQGTVYKIDSVSGLMTNVADFYGNGGAGPLIGGQPAAGLMNDGMGYLWGTTSSGGIQVGTGNGTVFKISIATGAASTVSAFGLDLRDYSSPQGKSPSCALVADGAGSFWGTASAGGPDNSGTIFKVNPANGALTLLAWFSANPNATTGRFPRNRLVSDGLGNLWGTTDGLISTNVGKFGTIFKITPQTSALTTVIQFTGISTGSTLGNYAAAGLVADETGMLWGTTAGGGINDVGTIFKLNPITNGYAIQTQFTDRAGPVVGIPSRGDLVSDGNGYLWGTSAIGPNPNGASSVFKVKIQTGELTQVAQIPGFYRGEPSALAGDGAGNFWGTTSGGNYGEGPGIAYKVNAITGELTTMATFGLGAGSFPTGGLDYDGAGNFWGVNSSGVFRLSTSGALSQVFQFTGSGGAVPGADPKAGLLRHTDGNLYGTTVNGGVKPGGGIAGGGQVFRVRFGPTPRTLPAWPVGVTTATLQGTLDPNGATTTASFEYSADPKLVGATVIDAGVSTLADVPQLFTARISGLIPGNIYYYRVRGVNAENSIPQRGEILSFIASATPPSYGTWITSFGLNATIAPADADTDQDGLKNAVEYVLGSNPKAPTATEKLMVNLDGENCLFKFNRADSAETPDVTLTVEISADLLEWNVYHIGANSAESSPGVIVAENGTAPDLIRVAVPRGTSNALFARIKVVVIP